MAYATDTQIPGVVMTGRIGKVRAAIEDRFVRYARYRRTLNELEQLNDRDLSDLGISRADIQDLAREAAWDK